MPALKYSRQREAIKCFLMTRKDHPTADVVYHSLRADFPNISLGTVYRNLTLLADPGEIARLRLGDGVDHFDADTSRHYHFICRNAAAFSTCTPNFRIPSILFTRHPWMETGSTDMQCIFRGSATAV